MKRLKSGFAYWPIAALFVFIGFGLWFQFAPKPRAYVKETVFAKTSRAVYSGKVYTQLYEVQCFSEDFTTDKDTFDFIQEGTRYDFHVEGRHDSWMGKRVIIGANDALR